MCEFAREAGLQAMTEQFAAEIPPDSPDDDSRPGPRRRPTRHADVRIEGEPGELVTWIDVSVTSSRQRRGGDWITKAAGKLFK